ncbi:VanW family protein [soil metagenome]
MSIWGDDDAETDLDETAPPKRERAGGRLVFFLILFLALLAGGGYAGAYYLAGDNVPQGTTVAGVDIGGRTDAAAAAVLEAGLAERVTSPITLVVDGAPSTLDPATIGLGVDYTASVAEAGGGASWDPQRLWDYYTSGDDLAPVVTVDDAALDAALEDLATSVARAPRDGTVRFVSGRVVSTVPADGRGLDVEAARGAIVAAYLTDEPVTLTTRPVAPDIDANDVRSAIDTFANPALSAPVTLKFGRSRVRLQPEQYVRALSLEADGGVLVPTVEQRRIVKLVKEATAGSGAPVDARIELVGNKPRVVPAKAGVSFEPDDIGATFLELVAAPTDERELRVPAQVEQPAFTTRDAKALRVKEKVSEFTTYFPYAEYRNTNIGRAAEIVDGTLLKPDDVFSLNDIVGERTRENGFTDGFIISNGIFKEDLGGGVSQMATTTFNAMFFAGLEDVEHKAHSLYIDRYPVGREATVAFGTLDLRFRNDTDYGVLIHSTLKPATPSSQGVLTVQMYSTKVWDITTTASDRYAFTSPSTRVLRTADCDPNTGYGGFQIDVKRIFRKTGQSKVDHVESFHTVYTPSDTVICKPPRPAP